MIDRSVKCKRQLAFELQSSRSNNYDCNETCTLNQGKSSGSLNTGSFCMMYGKKSA